MRAAVCVAGVKAEEGDVLRKKKLYEWCVFAFPLYGFSFLPPSLPPAFIILSHFFLLLSYSQCVRISSFCLSLSLCWWNWDLRGNENGFNEIVHIGENFFVFKFLIQHFLLLHGILSTSLLFQFKLSKNWYGLHCHSMHILFSHQHFPIPSYMVNSHCKFTITDVVVVALFSLSLREDLFKIQVTCRKQNKPPRPIYVWGCKWLRS
jgi:hypothetical protein